MVVAIFRSLEGASLEDFSIRLAQQWRVGQKGLDNGVILLVFVDERKVRLEVGYGLEPVIPDATAGQIIREVIAPRFRERQFAAGLEAAVNAVFARVGQGKDSSRPSSQRSVQPRVYPRDALWLLLAFGLIGSIISVALISAWRSAHRHAYTAGRRGWSSPSSGGPWWWGSSGWGGGGGGGFSGGGGGFGGGGASGDW